MTGHEGACLQPIATVVVLLCGDCTVIGVSLSGWLCMTIMVRDMSFSVTVWTDLPDDVIEGRTCGVCKVTAGEGWPAQYAGQGEEFQTSEMSFGEVYPCDMRE